MWLNWLAFVVMRGLMAYHKRIPMSHRVGVASLLSDQFADMIL